MKKISMWLALICLAGGAYASDLILDIQLNGSELEEGHKVERVLERGLLVIEDFGAETNVYSGTLYLYTTKGYGKNRTCTYEPQDAVVRIVANDHSQFGMLVELETAYLAGIGRAMVDKNGNFKQIIISSGHGVFLYAGFHTDPVSTNTIPVDGLSSNVGEIVEVDDDVLEELETGKMMAKLNKKLTDAAQDASGKDVVEFWLEKGKFPKKNDLKDKGKGKKKDG